MEIYSDRYEGVTYSLIEEKGLNGYNKYTIKANGLRIYPVFEEDNRDLAIARFNSVVRSYI